MGLTTITHPLKDIQNELLNVLTSSFTLKDIQNKLLNVLTSSFTHLQVVHLFGSVFNKTRRKGVGRAYLMIRLPITLTEFSLAISCSKMQVEHLTHAIIFRESL